MVIGIIQNILSEALWYFIKEKMYLKQNISNKKLDENKVITVKKEMNIDVEYIEYALRLRLFLENLNLCIEEKFSPSKISEYILNDSPKNSINFFKGIDIPNFEYLKQLEDNFGLNIDFFHGISDSIYNYQCIYFSSQKDFYEILTSDKYKKVFFVMDDVGQVSIIGQLSKFKFDIIRNNLFIHNEVGSTGLSKMKDLKSLLERFVKNSTNYISKTINYEDHKLLLNGHVHPYILIKNDKLDSLWVDDFIDNDYFLKNKELYKDKHGSIFFNALELINA